MTAGAKPVKCVVWDLDNTLWDGVLLEGDHVSLRPEIVDVIKILDERGILHSIASRSDYEKAMEKLSEFGLADFFLFPQINWGPKSVSVAHVAEQLNIGTDALAFIDDDQFELDEVAAGVEGVLCLDAKAAVELADLTRMQPRFITEDSRQRRANYRAEIRRQEAAEEMAPTEFLRSLGMVFTIAEAETSDLARVEELTVRTNQLNSTGVTYSFEELDALRNSQEHLLLIAGLDDRYGSYGKIGIALVDKSSDAWILRLLLMSCRVMSRGVGKVLLTHILEQAAAESDRVVADFVRTPQNRPIYLMFKMAGFDETDLDGAVARLEHDLSVIDPIPDWVELKLGG